MADCELCGREAVLYDAIVEGSVVSVCKDCTKYGNVIIVEPKRIKEVERIKARLPEEGVDEFVVDDYAKKIKEAREKIGLKQEELAEKIHEKESVIHKIESSVMVPDLKLARKLETVLGIKLVEGYKGDIGKSNLNFKNTSLTIGDLLELKKEKDL